MGAMWVGLQFWRARGRGTSAMDRGRIGLLLAAAFAGGIAFAAHAAAATAPVAAAQVRTSYDATTTFAAARDMLKAHKVLEKAQVFMSPLRLPRELTVRTAECGAPFLPYDPAKGVITLSLIHI